MPACHCCRTAAASSGLSHSERLAGANALPSRLTLSMTSIATNRCPQCGAIQPTHRAKSSRCRHCGSTVTRSDGTIAGTEGPGAELFAPSQSGVRCVACGKVIADQTAARNGHGTMHVRRGEARMAFGSRGYSFFVIAPDASLAEPG